MDEAKENTLDSNDLLLSQDVKDFFLNDDFGILGEGGEEQSEEESKESISGGSSKLDQSSRLDDDFGLHGNPVTEEDSNPPTPGVWMSARTSRPVEIPESSFDLMRTVMAEMDKEDGGESVVKPFAHPKGKGWRQPPKSTFCPPLSKGNLHPINNSHDSKADGPSQQGK